MFLERKMPNKMAHEYWHVEKIILSQLNLLWCGSWYQWKWTEVFDLNNENSTSTDFCINFIQNLYYLLIQPRLIGMIAKSSSHYFKTKSAHIAELIVQIPFFLFFGLKMISNWLFKTIEMCVYSSPVTVMAVVKNKC